MSEKFPRLTAKDIIKVVERHGFVLGRQSGSHRIYKDKQGKRVTIPFHRGKVLHPKVVKSILKDANLTLKELRKLLT